MGYAEVSVNSPAAQRRTFSYSIPPGMYIKAGQAVWVPFGNKLLQGIVIEITGYPGVTETREIAGVIEERPLLSPSKISLARWISSYYLCPLFEALALMLPPGFKRKALTYLSASPVKEEQNDTEILTREQKEILDLIRSKGDIDYRIVARAFGARKTKLVTAQLLNRGLITRSYRLEKSRVGPKKVSHLKLLFDPLETGEAEKLQKGRKAVQQARLIELLTQSHEPMPLAELRKEHKFSSTVIRSILEKGLAGIEEIEEARTPKYPNSPETQALALTGPQKSALYAIKESIKIGEPGDIFMLHGITASGKTEVYLQALSEALKIGKRAIVLVPEISLTPQTIERFASRFPGRVAVLHSGLSMGEKYDEWRRIESGAVDVVIGSRSAIFAPQPDLGLIVIDEEHEWTYKQHDTPPLYHAREVAKKLAGLIGTTVILGSATPDVESFFHSLNGRYRLLSLPERVVPRKGAPLPDVEIVDMRSELKMGNRSIFSRALSRSIASAVAAKEQVILFLNRRGGSTFIQCRNCGYVLRCPRCTVTMTYHSAEDRLVCHQCNHKMTVPLTCPNCLSQRIKFMGTGTEKLEKEVSIIAPQARLLRWDRDTVRRKGSHQEILDAFINHNADILIGTQMIAKGLHLPLVTLVGIINADISLNIPDFRSGERTYQLLSQVLGRAGRGTSAGKVVIQTYLPDHYSIQSAAHHDYGIFYDKEIGYRRLLGNPPFSNLACLTYVHPNEDRCQKGAERMKKLLNDEIYRKGIEDLSLLGPAPAFIYRLRGRFRWQLILRGADPSAFLAEIPVSSGWSIDIDPVGIA